MPSEKSIFIDQNMDNFYLRDDVDLFERRFEYEQRIVEERDSEYLNERYGVEIDFQTDISIIK